MRRLLLVIAVVLAGLLAPAAPAAAHHTQGAWGLWLYCDSRAQGVVIDHDGSYTLNGRYDFVLHPCQRSRDYYAGKIAGVWISENAAFDQYTSTGVYYGTVYGQPGGTYHWFPDDNRVWIGRAWITVCC